MENVSLLDLPAFGSTIGTLRQDLKKQFNWPIEISYATLKSNPSVNLSIISKSYKTLIEDWGYHMKKMDKSDEHKNTFTQNMENNTYLNFTKFIQADMKTFLIALAGKVNLSISIPDSFN